MDKESLQSHLEEMRKELMKVNTQIATGSAPENPGKAKQLKKTIARILTLLNQKGNLEVKKSNE